MAYAQQQHPDRYDTYNRQGEYNEEPLHNPYAAAVPDNSSQRPTHFDDNSYRDEEFILPHEQLNMNVAPVEKTFPRPEPFRAPLPLE